jgi:lauroyl/myristoyl acyltransferase
LENIIDLEEADELLFPLFKARGARGLLLVAIHACGSDLVTQVLSRRGYRAMWLTLPELRGGYRAHFEMRRRSGMQVYPTSTATLRQAVKYLQDGGVVGTGIDRPLPSPHRRPRFFGRPSSLPTFHIRLALQAQVPVAILAPLMQADGRYHVRLAASIQMLPDPDPESEILRNSERVLEVVEDLIRSDPTQWAMTLPVWPEALAAVP